MFEPKYKLDHDEVRIIVYALVELKNQLIEEGRYGDSICYTSVMHMMKQPLIFSMIISLTVRL